LADSDILIEVTRGRDIGIISRWTELGQSDSAILYSPVSGAEVWAGARPAEHDALNVLFQTRYRIDSSDFVELHGALEAMFSKTGRNSEPMLRPALAGRR